MATSVVNTETLELSDGTTVLLKPLVIKQQRKFMHEWNKIDDVDGQDEVLDVYIKCSAVCLSKALKEAVPNQYDDKFELTEEYREYLEETLELDTIFKILEVCAGLKLNDPKLLEAVAEAAGQDGQSLTS